MSNSMVTPQRETVLFKNQNDLISLLLRTLGINWWTKHSKTIKKDYIRETLKCQNRDWTRGINQNELFVLHIPHWLSLKRKMWLDARESIMREFITQALHLIQERQINFQTKLNQRKRLRKNILKLLTQVVILVHLKEQCLKNLLDDE